MSQITNLLSALKRADTQGVCVDRDLHDHHTYGRRVAARILDLRRQGWTITSEPCMSHPHRARVARYTLHRNGRLF